MASFAEYTKKKKKQQSAEGVSFADYTKSVLGGDDIAPVRNEEYYSNLIGFDTFNDDLNTLGTTVNSIYSGWQDADTMKNTKSSVSSMYNRLTAFQEYNELYGDGSVDITETVNAYKTILDEWDTLSERYGEYKNADEYNKAYEKAQVEAKVLEEKNNRSLDDYQVEIDDLEAKLEKAEAIEEKINYSENQLFSVNAVKAAREVKAAQAQLNEYLTSIGYKSVDDLRGAVNTLKSDKKNAWRYQELKKYGSVADVNSANYDTEYDIYSQKGADIENPTFEEAQGNAFIFGWRPGAKDIGNIVTFSNENAGKLIVSQLNGNNPAGNADYSLMTEEEVKLYNYYLAKDKEKSTNKAEEYLELLQQDFENRKGLNIANQLKGNTALELLFAVPAGLDQFGQGVKNAFNTSDDYIPYSAVQVASSIVREDLSDDGFEVLGSSVGQIAYDTINTTSNMLPSILVSTINPTAGAVTMGISAAGNAYQQTLNMGWDKSEARTYSTLVGISEAAMSATISKAFGGKVLNNKVQTAINGIDNGLARFAANYGYAAASEGFEEAAQEVLNPLFENIALGYNKNGFEDINWEEVAYSGLLGAFSGGAFEIAGSAANKINGVKLTENEQKVVDFEVEKRIAEKKTDGKKLTQTEKKAIEKQVKSDLEKGYISTDTIEEVLGGETYKTYKNTLDNEETLRKEFDTLNKMKQGEMTGEQIDRRAELKQQLEELKTTSNKDSLKAQLSDEVFGIVKDSKLAESYNENTRRGQAFEADLSQYDEKYQGTIKKAVESGILNNTRRTHEFVDMIAKISADKGVLFDFADNEKIKNSSYALEGKIVNGYVDESGNVVLNINSAKALNSTAGHEITHILEGTELYDTFAEIIIEHAKTKGEYQSRLEALNKLYEGVYEGDNFAEKVNKELVADLVGDYIFTDKDFIRKLSIKNRNIFEKIYDEIKYLCKVATAGSKEARELEKVKKTFAEVYRNSGKAEKNTAENGGVIKYSLMNDVTFEKNAEDVINMPDEVALKNKEQGNFIRVMNNTPSVILENVKDAGDYEVIIRFDALYLAAREDGALEGHYHNLGKDIITKLPQFIENPDAIVRMKNGRLNIFTTIETPKGNNGIISMEMNTVKDINSKYNKYNLVVSVFSAKDSYTKNNLSKNGVEVEYKKEDLSQVNPQLYEWLAIFNDKSSNISISNPAEKVNTKKSNELAPVKKSLSEQNEASIKQSNLTYGEEIKLKTAAMEETENATVEEDIAPIKEIVSKTENAKTDLEKAAADYVESNIDDVNADIEIFKTKDIFAGKRKAYVRRLTNGTYESGTYAIGSGGFVPNENVIRTDSLEEAMAEQYAYMLSNGGEEANRMIRKHANNYDNAHKVEDIAPVYNAPISEDEANAQASERLDSLTDEDAPIEIGDSYYEMPDTTSIDDKTLKNIGKSLRETLSLTPQETKAIQEIVQEYSTTEFSSKEELFTKIKEQFGDKVWKQRNDEVADVKRWIRDKKIAVSNTIKGDIADWSRFRKSMGSKITTSKEGLPVDIAYQEMVELFPDFFSADISNPTDQFLRICEIADLEVYENHSYPLDDDTIQEAVNIISNEVNSYKEDLTRTAAEETARENLDNIAPVKASSVDGVFFDEKNAQYSLSEIVEDIAPTKAVTEQNLPDDFAPVAVDEQAELRGKQRKWVETSTESKVVNGKILPDDLDQAKITYQPISNKKTLNGANLRLNSLGYESSVVYFNSQFANRKTTVEDIALGERLIQEAIKRGDTKTAGELIQDVAILGTELGQKVQALSIIKRLTPEGQLGMIQRIVERGKTKGDKAFEGVELTQEMMDKILSVYNKDGTYDQKKLNAVVEEVKQEIADNMQVTKMEKVNTWRYLAMLGNPKTHIRNIVSNLAMRATISVKNVVARTIESVAPIENRTKTWKRATDEVKQFAMQTAEEMKDIISGDDKYSESTSIKSNRRIFKNKILNGLYEFNSEMLNKEDWWFSRPAFTNALSEFLTANGISTAEDIKNNPEIVEKAKIYATEQAQIATFRQYSWLANKINDIERKNNLTNIAVGAVLPFKKTPINIAKTGLNYSPLGFMKTLTYDISQVKNGNMGASELIDNLSQNITGTALTLVGYLLASAGFLNGSGNDDKEGEYDYQLGEQSYSISIGDKTFSLSWLSPVAMPLFVGANAYEQLVEGKEWNGDVVIETLAQTLDPLSEMSFLSSLNSVLSSYDSGIQKFAGIGETAAQNYITQFAPTLSSQIAAVFDDTKRSTKVSGDSGFKFVDETINKLKLKIPFLRETLEPSIDIWGNEVKQAENVLTRAFESFIAPYSTKENIATEIDAEIKSLYSQVGDDGLIPSIPYNYVNYKDEKYKMSAEEYTSFKQTYGQTAYNLLGDLFATDTYRNSSAEEKADLVNKVYDYARDEAKRQFLANHGVEYTNTTKNKEPYYQENSIKGAVENDMTTEEYDFYVSNPEKYAVAKSVGGYEAYKSYSSDLSNIKSDKDSDGKTISGSRKEKVIDYINNLDADYGEKIILFKSEYNSDDTYNYEIIDYLNGREDISYEEMETILKVLGFTVLSDGTIQW